MEDITLPFLKEKICALHRKKYELCEGTFKYDCSCAQCIEINASIAKETATLYDKPRICSICYEDIRPETGSVVTSCNHSFHFRCLTSWYSKQSERTCPNCRKNISGLEDFAETDDIYQEKNESATAIEHPLQFTRESLELIFQTRFNCTLTRDTIINTIGEFNEESIILSYDTFCILCGEAGASSLPTEEDWLDIYNISDETIDYTTPVLNLLTSIPFSQPLSPAFISAAFDFSLPLRLPQPQ